MARYDKVDPISGSFRAPLNADLTATEDTGTGPPVGVTINVSGRVVVGSAVEPGDPIVGVLCTTRNMKAGDIVDVMTAGEIVEMPAATFVAGVSVWCLTTGVLDATAPGVGANKCYVGTMVEAGRLVVRLGSVQGV